MYKKIRSTIGVVFAMVFAVMIAMFVYIGGEFSWTIYEAWAILLGFCGSIYMFMTVRKTAETFQEDEDL